MPSRAATVDVGDVVSDVQAVARTRALLAKLTHDNTFCFWMINDAQFQLSLTLGHEPRASILRARCLLRVRTFTLKHLVDEWRRKRTLWLLLLR